MSYVEERIAEVKAEAINRVIARETLVQEIKAIQANIEKHNEARVGFVYFVKSGAMVKIGFTTDLEQRMKTIRNGNPHELTLLGAVPGTDDTEFFFYQMFYRYRSTGEWFRIEGDLDMFLARLPSDAKSRKRGRKREIRAWI